MSPWKTESASALSVSYPEALSPECDARPRATRRDRQARVHVELRSCPALPTRRGTSPRPGSIMARSPPLRGPRKPLAAKHRERHPPLRCLSTLDFETTVPEGMVRG